MGKGALWAPPPPSKLRSLNPPSELRLKNCNCALLKTFCTYFVFSFVSYCFYIEFDCLIVSFLVCQLLRSYGQVVLFFNNWQTCGRVHKPMAVERQTNCTLICWIFHDSIVVCAFPLFEITIQPSEHYGYYRRVVGIFFPCREGGGGGLIWDFGGLVSWKYIFCACAKRVFSCPPSPF